MLKYQANKAKAGDNEAAIINFTRERKLEWQSRTIGSLKKDEVLIETITGAISIGTELKQYNETDMSDYVPHYPRETGYESFGRVLEREAKLKKE